jgi:hypothetical protein
VGSYFAAQHFLKEFIDVLKEIHSFQVPEPAVFKFLEPWGRNCYVSVSRVLAITGQGSGS